MQRFGSKEPPAPLEPGRILVSSLANRTATIPFDPARATYDAVLRLATEALEIDPATAGLIVKGRMVDPNELLDETGERSPSPPATRHSSRPPRRPGRSFS